MTGGHRAACFVTEQRMMRLEQRYVFKAKCGCFAIVDHYYEKKPGKWYFSIASSKSDCFTRAVGSRMCRVMLQQQWYLNDKIGQMVPPENVAKGKLAEEMRDRLPITHVAIRFQGKIWSLPKPNRHHDVIRHIVEQTGVDYVDAHGDDQGFLDASGRYLRRAPALMSAELNGQIIRRSGGDGCRELYSEDVW